eukprot:6602349-Pyramimonas_sp.AAC.1
MTTPTNRTNIKDLSAYQWKKKVRERCLERTRKVRTSLLDQKRRGDTNLATQVCIQFQSHTVTCRTNSTCAEYPPNVFYCIYLTTGLRRWKQEQLKEELRNIIQEEVLSCRTGNDGSTPP